MSCTLVLETDRCVAEIPFRNSLQPLYVEDSRQTVQLLLRNRILHNHKGVIQVAALNEVVLKERFQLMEENKGSARSNLSYEICILLKPCILISKHFGVKIYHYVYGEMVIRKNNHLAPLLVAADNLAVQYQILSWSVLLNQPVLGKGFCIVLCTAVQNRNLRRIQSNESVVYSHSVECPHKMLQSKNLYSVLIQCCSSGSCTYVIHTGFNQWRTLAKV